MANPASIGLYIHIPFCETKCNYCNFNTYTRLEPLVPAYIEALCKEIDAWGERLGHPATRTVFLGGGTPSWLPVDALKAVLDASRRALPWEPDAEVTAEANPGDVDQGKVEAWLAAGGNRVSMGVQSLDDGLLRLLTRRHTAREAVTAFGTLRRAGVQNINLDFIYGLPHQTLDVWRTTLDRVAALSPAHVSAYALTVEEGTPLWSDVKKGHVPYPDADLAADMYEMAESVLDSAGYRHYEISNWAQPGNECRHNLIYWRNEQWLGVGPGAHSHLNGERFWTIKSPAEYVKRLAEAGPGEVPVIESRQTVTPLNELSETLILRLRLDEGVAMGDIASRFAEASLTPPIQTLERLREMGLVTREGDVFRLTQRGRLLSNEVFVRLLPEALPLALAAE